MNVDDVCRAQKKTRPYDDDRVSSCLLGAPDEVLVEGSCCCNRGMTVLGHIVLQTWSADVGLMMMADASDKAITGKCRQGSAVG